MSPPRSLGQSPALRRRPRKPVGVALAKVWTLGERAGEAAWRRWEEEAEGVVVVKAAVVVEEETRGSS